MARWLTIFTLALVACSERNMPPPPASFLSAPSPVCASSETSDSQRFACTPRTIRISAASHSAAISGTIAETPDASALLDWAEVHYAQYFSTKERNQFSGPYVYRYYPKTRNYLGIAGRDIYVLGPISGDTLAYVGSLDQFRCSVSPAACSPASQRLVVSPDGSDNNDGTLLRPLKSISKAIDLAGPGDTIYLRTGLYRETAALQRSGENGRPITITSLEGEQATISGADQITGWEAFRDGIYVAKVTNPVHQVFIDGERLNLAQYPSSGYLFMQADADNKQEIRVLPNDVADRDLVGAGVHIRTVPWTFDDRTVTRVEGGRVNLSSPLYDIPRANYGYYFDNKLWMLTEVGQWYHDTSRGLLYIRPQKQIDPNFSIVEASTRSAITGKGVNFVTVKSISIERTMGDAVAFQSSRDVLLEKLKISDSVLSAILIEGASTAKIEDCDIINSVHDGVVVLTTGGVSVMQNRISNIGTIGPPTSSTGAIYSYTGNMQIVDNSIINTGYRAISFYRNTLIQGNRIENPCLKLSDCGAIYMWDAASARYTEPSNASILENLVLAKDSSSNRYGTPGMEYSAGIYLDGYTDGIIVRGNTISGSHHGIFLNSSRNHKITGNTVFGSTVSQIFILEGDAPSIATGIAVSDNILFPTSQASAIWLGDTWGTLKPIGFDGNMYGGLYSQRLFRIATRDEPTRTLDIAGWRDRYSQDSRSSISPPFEMRPFVVLQEDSRELISNPFFSGSSVGWSVWSEDGAGRLLVTPTCDGFASSPCLSVSASQGTLSLLISNAFSLRTDTQYRLRFDLFASKTSEDTRWPWAVWIRRNGPTYDTLGLTQEVDPSSQWKSYEFLFNATEAGSNFARLDVQMPPGSEALIDNVSIRAVKVLETGSLDNQRLLVNWAKTTEAIQCPDIEAPQRCSQYVDLTGAPVTFPVLMSARSAKIVVWAASPFRR